MRICNSPGSKHGTHCRCLAANATGAATAEGIIPSWLHAAQALRPLP